MEVASPLTTFEQRTAGTKRHLVAAFSSSFMDSTTRTPLAAGFEHQHAHQHPHHGAHAMGHIDGSQQRSFKRRRFTVDSSMDDVENITPQSPFAVLPAAPKAFSSPAAASPNPGKRCRTDAYAVAPPVVQEDLRPLLESQASEIASLKADKSNLESSMSGMKTDFDRVVKENKLLRKAVTIQQDRQNHANNELAEARKFRTDAQTQIGKLEQMILKLQYHLQTQNSHPGNDFMGFPPRPPDVY